MNLARCVPYVEMRMRDTPREGLGRDMGAASPSLAGVRMIAESGGECGAGREAARAIVVFKAGAAPSAIT